MTLVGQILRAYRGARGSMRNQMAQNPGEERLLIYVVLASLLFLVARLPSLIQVANATAEGERTATAIIAGNLTGSLFFGPLLLYALGAISHLVAKAMNGRGTFFDARLALFWALLVSAPLALLSSMISVVLPITIVGQTSNLLVFLAFSYFWASNISVAEKYQSFVPAMIFLVLTVLGLTAAARFSIM